MQPGKSFPLIRGISASKSPEYQCWVDMRARCGRKTHPAYKDYGARGIIVCESWRLDFWAFFEAMGQRPSPAHSIERINNDGIYEPRNCRWATAEDQANNKRRTRFVETEIGVLPAAKAGRAGLINYNALNVREFKDRKATAGSVRRVSSDRWRMLAVIVDGAEVLLADYVRHRGLDYDLVLARLRYGWDLETATSRPARKKARGKAD